MILLVLSLIAFTMIVLCYLTYKLYEVMKKIAKVIIGLWDTVQTQTGLLLALAIPVSDKDDLLVKDLPEDK